MNLRFTRICTASTLFLAGLAHAEPSTTAPVLDLKLREEISFPELSSPTILDESQFLKLEDNLYVFFSDSPISSEQMRLVFTDRNLRNHRTVFVPYWTSGGFDNEALLSGNELWVSPYRDSNLGPYLPSFRVDLQKVKALKEGDSMAADGSVLPGYARTDESQFDAYYAKRAEPGTQTLKVYVGPNFTASAQSPLKASPFKNVRFLWKGNYGDVTAVIRGKNTELSTLDDGLGALQLDNRILIPRAPDFTPYGLEPGPSTVKVYDATPATGCTATLGPLKKVVEGSWEVRPESIDLQCTQP